MLFSGAGCNVFEALFLLDFVCRSCVDYPDLRGECSETEDGESIKSAGGGPAKVILLEILNPMYEISNRYK